MNEIQTTKLTWIILRTHKDSSLKIHFIHKTKRSNDIDHIKLTGSFGMKRWPKDDFKVYRKIAVLTYTYHNTQFVIQNTTKLLMLFYHLSSDIDVGDGFPLAVTHIDVSILSDFMLYFMDRPFKFR